MSGAVSSKIQVKRSDGTVVYMSLHEALELKKKKAAERSKKQAPTSMKRSSSSTNAQKSGVGALKKVAPKNLPAVSGTKALSTTTPVTDLFIDEAAAKQAEGKSKVHARAPQKVQKQKKTVGALPQKEKPAPSLKGPVAVRKQVLTPQPKKKVLPATTKKRSVAPTPVTQVQKTIEKSQEQKSTPKPAQTAKPEASVKPPAPESKKSPADMKQLMKQFHPPKKSLPKKNQPKPQTVVQEKTEQWDSDDSAALLDETLDVSSPAVPKVSEHRAQDYKNVIAVLDAQVEPNLQGRLHSLIQSRIKEVRTDEQVMEYAMRSKEQGGLDMNEARAVQLIEAMHKKVLKDGKRMELKKELKTRKPSQPKAKPATSVAAVVPPKPSDVVAPAPRLQSVQAPSVPQKNIKPTMHDVQAPAAPDVGPVSPVDELVTMTLVDFRRLSDRVDEARQIVLAKLHNLGQESYMLYSDGLAAWFKSPLYNQYLEVIARSIGARTPLANTLNEMEMTPDEFQAILEINESLDR